MIGIAFFARQEKVLKWIDIRKSFKIFRRIDRVKPAVSFKHSI